MWHGTSVKQETMDEFVERNNTLIYINYMRKYS